MSQFMIKTRVATMTFVLSVIMFKDEPFQIGIAALMATFRLLSDVHAHSKLFWCLAFTLIGVMRCRV